MVTNNHYRWDFVGLSTDEKPTPDTSDKVVDGSTFYCSDTSKLYVFCKSNWYERKPLGSGGGTSYTAGDGITIADDTISVDTTTIQEKLTAGTGIDITDNTISATGGGGTTVVQTAGTSTTDVMSQNATTSMVFDDPNVQVNIKIGERASILQPNGAVVIGSQASCRGKSVAIGSQANASVDGTIAIGAQATLASSGCVAIGNSSYGGNRAGGTAIGTNASVGHLNSGSVALGANTICTRPGEVYIGTTNTEYGYNTTNYRVLGGVHDPVDAHDAATKGYVDANAGYNFYSQAVESAFNEPEVEVSITVAEYQALENACINLGKLYYAFSDNINGYYFRDDAISYECFGGNGSINIFSNSTGINGNFAFQSNNGEPTVMFISNV